MNNNPSSLASLSAQRFIAQRDERYHHARAEWFCKLEVLGIWAGLAGGSGAILAAIDAIPARWVPLVVGVAVTLFSLWQLASRFDEKRCHHETMAKRYRRWSSSMNGVDPGDAAALKLIADELDLIGADERDFYRVVDTIAHNGAARQLQSGDVIYDVRPWRQALGHLFRFPNYRPDPLIEVTPPPPPPKAAVA